ncbi:PREDICTED: linoleate 13S-lipoxygenase 3-1, chloroplastic-like [Nelumbo nucifera]|uniref:Lipoxygenase n=2 Tax=Nelumbo nucifera TaxID=4432 RepID=A0A822ZH63_NELNU|nr:PREDICTED: linoleate 13S-lipoxygenase 3-1, chloroplastic-like [Nelumbo nucifera]DAD44237.1 TPA_asm: hypothetical protein HUJ06_002467 [Nelumbo nucifera]
MAGVNETLGLSLVERSCLLPSSGSLLNHRLNWQPNKLRFTPVLLSPEQRRVHLRRVSRIPIAAISENFVIVAVEEQPVKFKVRAVVTVRKKHKEDLKETIVKHLDALTDKIGRNVVLQLVSTEVDSKTKAPKKSSEAVLNWSKKWNVRSERVNYTAEFTVDSSFGIPGAITVSNKHQKEFFLENITIEGFACGPVHFACNSWVQSTKDHPGSRIFFSNKPYLPWETPDGLKELREKELRGLRGDGKGARKLSDRIYDYDTYKDLGNPDKGVEFSRATLGGEDIPYPRRCRTGRPPTETDMNAESRAEKPVPIYVPRDEAFEESKQKTFSVGRLKAVLHNLIPSLFASLSADDNHDFKDFCDVDSLYKEGLLLKLGLQDELMKKLPLPNIVSKLQESSQSLLRYDTPTIVSRDKFAWLRDDEFARQTLAGINPVSIRRLEVFPPVSQLDPEVYGPQESALKEEHIVGYLGGLSVQQAMEENKLFTLDYHDIYLPFLERINALEGRKAYATRTIFFLTPLGTLKPIAIELSLPYTGSHSQSTRVLTPPVDATTSWLWQLARAHVCSNDAGVHQLVNHWLRTHASIEPFVIAAHRQLSAMHPIFKLLDPHMRYTLDINALARQTLISAEGVIESCFTPGPYCMEISAAAYRSLWRFDLEGLPADLIRRGMAVLDLTQPHGLKLLIEDYPYANDGLLIWDAIESWVRTYVNHYYGDSSSSIRTDTELQAWYSESINQGHADLRHQSWWPSLSTVDDLVSILTTLIWLASAQHAALNFGQYPYGGYVPNRPPLMRRLLPQEDDPEYANFRADPHRFFLSSLPTLLQATQFMAVVDTLSTHSPDEEYLGERQQPSTWSGDAEIIEALYGFSAEIRGIEKEIQKRNHDPNLRNRCGAGVLPYELLVPSSEPGVTCRGVPNSVSI